MKSIYEEAGGTYTRQGDYELPDLKVPPEKEIEIGIWGQRHRRYLKQYHKNSVLQSADFRNAEQTSGRGSSTGGAAVSITCIRTF